MNFLWNPWLSIIKSLIVVWIKQARNEIIFLVTSSCVKKYSNYWFVVMVFSLVIEVHFKVIMSTIYCMLRGCVKMKLFWPKNFIATVWFVHNKITFNVMNFNPNGITQIFDTNICYFSILCFESKHMQSFEDITFPYILRKMFR